MIDDLKFLQLWDLYSPLLTPTQREITDLYFNYDLSLGEIAEQKNVSRQSVSDCLQKSRKQLETYEKKLQFSKALIGVSREYSAYMTTVERFVAKYKEQFPTLEELEKSLQKLYTAAEVEETENGKIVGTVFREEE